MKSTNTFKGLVSWICLLTVLCAACVAVVFAVMVLVNPGILEYVTENVHDFAATVPQAVEEYSQGDVIASVAQADALVYE